MPPNGCMNEATVMGSQHIGSEKARQGLETQRQFVAFGRLSQRYFAGLWDLAN